MPRHTYKELTHFKALVPELNVNGKSIQSFKKGRSSLIIKDVVTLGALKSAPDHTLFLLLNILKSFTKYFVSRGVLKMIEI